MITARVFTNLDGKYITWYKSFRANFPGVPSVGQTIQWHDWSCRIVSVGWEEVKNSKNGAGDVNYELVVEFNK